MTDHRIFSVPDGLTTELELKEKMLWDALCIVSAGEPPIQVLCEVFGEEQVKKIYKGEYEDWWAEEWIKREEEESDNDESDA